MMVDRVFHLSYSLILVAFYISRCEGECCQRKNTLSRCVANSFLVVDKKHKCCEENYCESSTGECFTQTWRRYVQERYCSCPPGFAGKATFTSPCHYDCKCEVSANVNECLTSPCKNGATCHNTAYFWCQCSAGFTGASCETDINECLNSPCKNGATCHNMNGSFVCKCTKGFNGRLCQQDIDECRNSPCQNGATCQNTNGSFICHCHSGFQGQLCEEDIDECKSDPCQKGTCLNTNGSFTCQCYSGFEGQFCGKDVNECSHSPCKNGSTCSNTIGSFRCICADGFYGVLCDTDVCHPTPADVIFLLDSSISMTEDQFQKQLDFVVNFTNHVTVGPDDFQIGVVTFSFKAHVEFYLNNYTDNTALQSAIRRVTYKPGATFTNEALDKIPDMLLGMNGGNRSINNTRPARFVFLLTDGMSTDRKAAIEASKKIKYLIEISVIGVGNEVNHEELLDIATTEELIYSVQDFDSLYTVLKNLVYITCEKCWRSSKTDIAILLDTSSRVSEQQFQVAQNVLSQFIELIHLAINETRISMTSFGGNFSRLFEFGNFSSKNSIQIKINQLRWLTSSLKSSVDILNVLDYVNSSAFANTNNGSKKLAVLFSNGMFEKPDPSKLGDIKRQISEKNITVVCVSSGPDVDLYPLYDIVNDAFDVYVTDVDNVSQLSAMNSYITYSVCALDKD